MANECVCLESSVLPIIVTVALLIEDQPTDGTIDRAICIFPLTG
jgi:hypothetical protein